jgi:hypothetical protein
MGFEPTISAGELPHTYALDRKATGIGSIATQGSKFLTKWVTNSFLRTLLHTVGYTKISILSASQLNQKADTWNK